MADLSAPFLDTTVLVSGSIDMGTSSAPALAVLDAVAAGRLEGPMTAWHCCLEFYSVTTRLPEAFRLDPDEARRLVAEQLLPRLHVHELPESQRVPLFDLATAEGLAGGRIYDVHIAEIARHAQAPVVVTDNRPHFTALLRHGIRVLTTGEFAREAGLA